MLPKVLLSSAFSSPQRKGPGRDKGLATPPALSVAMRMATKTRNQMAGGFVRTLLRLKNCAGRELQVPDTVWHRQHCLLSQVHAAMARIWLLWHLSQAACAA